MKKPARNNFRHCLAVLACGLALFLAGVCFRGVQSCHRLEEYNAYNLAQMSALAERVAALQDTIETALFDNLAYTQLLNYEKAESMEIAAAPGELHRMLRAIKRGNEYIVDVFLFSLDNDIVVSAREVYNRQYFFKNVYEFDYSDIVSLMTTQHLAAAKEPLTVTKFVYGVSDTGEAQDTIAYFYTPTAVADRARSAIIITLDKEALLAYMQATELLDASGILLIGNDGTLLARDDARFLQYGYEVSAMKRMAANGGEEQGVIEEFLSADYAGALAYYQRLAGNQYTAVKLSHPLTLLEEQALQDQLWRTGILAALFAMLGTAALLVGIHRRRVRRGGDRSAYLARALAQLLFLGEKVLGLEEELRAAGCVFAGRQAVACRIWLDDTKGFLDRFSAHAQIACFEEIAGRMMRRLSARYAILPFIREELVIVVQARTDEPLEMEALVAEVRAVCEAFASAHGGQSFSARFGPIQEGMEGIGESYRAVLGAGGDLFGLPAQCSAYEEGTMAILGESLLSAEETQALTQWLLENQKPERLAELLRWLLPAGETMEIARERLYEIFHQAERCLARIESKQGEACLRYSHITSRLMACRSREELLAATEELLHEIRAEIVALRMESDRDHLLKKSMVQYMEENYMRDFSLAEAAEHFGLSPTYFSRIFKSLMGSNMVDYLHLLRMQKFKEYVAEHSDMPIKDVAKLVGYNSYKTFSRQYKKIFGTLPSNKTFL